jgi:tetratricopeptide (TPR) repeat protein
LSSWLPALHLLVTSRRMLGLDGECEHALAALGPPTSQSATTNSRVTLINPAVTLFVDRAQAVQPNFQVTPHNRQQLADVVQALHGLPLAIELAAARMRSLGLADLHTMLVQNPVPGASLALLARAGPRGLADPRHASMQLVLQWSWQQLDSEEQSLLAALASCDAGASLALLALLSDKPPSAVAARVDTLVAASVAYQRADAQGSSRFYVFEPMREFVFVHVGAAGLAQLRSAHARAMAQWAATLGREPLLAQVRAEIPNLMRALASASDPAVPAATPQQAINTLLAARHVLDDINLSASSLVHARQVAQLAPRHQAPALHALLAGHSFFAGEAEHARAHAQAALVALVAPGSEASAAITAAVQRDVARVLLRLGHPHDEVMALLHQALAGAEREGLAEVKALAKASIAVMHFRADHDVQANVQRHREVVALWRSHGPQVRITESLVGLAIALGFAHQLQEQLLVLQEARARATALGQRRLLAFCSSVTGYALADLKRYDEARAMYRQCLRMAWDDAAWREWFYALWNLPRTLAHQRQPEAAAQLMGFAQAFFAGRFGVLGREDLPEERRTRRLLHAQWGVQRTAAAWQAGAAISMREAMAMAMRWTEDAPMDGPTA